MTPEWDAIPGVPQPAEAGGNAHHDVFYKGQLTTHYHIGKYGRMRRAFLQEYRPIQYSDLVMTEKLFPHLSEIDEVEKLDAHRETECENFTPVSQQQTPKGGL